MARRKVFPIDRNWTFKQANTEDNVSFRPVAQFPTTVHLDLMHHGLIPDPFIGKNELDVQWIGEVDWVYRTTFHAPSAANGSKVVLAFDGLDTFATVLLNGSTIMVSDNMFTPERVDVTASIQHGENDLVITFECAYLRGWKEVEKHPKHKWGCWNGDSSRLAVRKAQYEFGWDWGPVLNTCGPWRPIYLEIYESRLADLYVDTTVERDLQSANVIVHAQIEGLANKVHFAVSLEGKSVVSETVTGSGNVQAIFHVSSPSLWYPIRYGKQTLYTVTATLLGHSDGEIDAVTKKIGIRHADLTQRELEDQPGTSFFFQVNNIPIYCGGSNWIPADNMLPRISRDRYYDWVKLIADGNQLMVRVWGGGIYEDQAFYDACDEYGILVWQDFMFGCGNYPAHPEFLKSVKREAEENVKLLRHHPSIVIWAGNNEDYQYQESSGLTYDYENKDAESWLETDFPARYIYEKILADVCADLIPGTAYHFGSPWGGGKPTSDPTIGDLHQWNVWHGSQEKYQNFDKLVGRFVSEFGMEAFPHIKTIESYLPKGKDDPDRFPQSSTVDFHNKANGHERRIALYLAENFRYAPDPIEQFIYCTQLMQGECIASAYRMCKRQWKGPGMEHCGGTLVWQINDCWPVTSWALVDYYLRPKHAYYTVKREMAPLSIGIIRREHRHPKNKYTRVHVKVRSVIEVWGSNLTLGDITVDCVLKAFDIETGRETYSQTLKKNVVLYGNRSTEILAIDVPGTVEEAARTIVAAYIVSTKSGQQLARYVNWPEPLKYLHLQKPKELKFVLNADQCAVEISAEVPIKGLALECDDERVKFDDNMVDIVPGEVMNIGVKGASRDTALTTRYLGMI